jgi:alkylated DNA repair protein (DNA oxidative demethylase)
MTSDLFESDNETMAVEPLGAESFVLYGAALPFVDRLLPALDMIQSVAPFRHMVTPGGFEMSVGLTNCGILGWTTDRRGYRYTKEDPITGLPWPAMPGVFMNLAKHAATRAGFPDFIPDACLINRYVPGARLSLHQDKNEADFSKPIVSVSLGIPAVFQFGGMARSDKPVRVPLTHGDVAVWGGVDRMRYHGVLPLKEATHPLLGAQRINFTFRKAG